MGKWILGNAALVLAGALAQADVPAEPRSPGKLTITADLDFTSVWRSNLVDFSDDRVLTSRAATGTAGKTTSKDVELVRVSDNDSATWVKLDLNFHADLGSDAYMVAQLRAGEINNRTYGATDGVASNSGSTAGGEAQFEVNVRQAYAHFNNFLLDKLAFRLGVQEMTEGLDRGNGSHFLLATGDLGHRFQIRDGGNVDYAFNGQGRAATATSADFTDTKEGANPGYGWKASYPIDMDGNTLNFDILWANLAETGTDSNDSEVFGIYGAYGFELAPKEKSSVLFHAANYRDGNTATEEGVAAPADRFGKGSNIWALGLGAQVNWENVEVFGEYDQQSGAFDDGVKAGTAGVTTANNEEDQSASAWYLGGKYSFKGMMGDVTPWVETSLWSYSGDDTPGDSDQEGYINYGSIHETLIVEDNAFGMGMSNNYGVWRVKGGFSGFKAPLGLKGSVDVDGSYNSFSVKEDQIVAANSRTGAAQTEDDLGVEWDLAVRWAYAENISFSLSFGWFMPGNAVSENVQLGGIAAAGGRASAANDDTVALIRLGSSFRF